MFLLTLIKVCTLGRLEVPRQRIDFFGSCNRIEWRFWKPLPDRGLWQRDPKAPKQRRRRLFFTFTFIRPQRRRPKAARRRISRSGRRGGKRGCGCGCRGGSGRCKAAAAAATASRLANGRPELRCLGRRRGRFRRSHRDRTSLQSTIGYCEGDIFAKAIEVELQR